MRDDGGSPTGVKLGSLVTRSQVELASSGRRSVGIDVPNVIYRHLFQIRGPDGQPYRNPDGDKVGHLIGLCNEISIVVKSGLDPIFVFDGKTPELKRETTRIRADVQKPGFKLDADMNDEMKVLLDLLGLPWIQAPEEAEAQTSHMTRDSCWASITNDYDALLFGSLRMIRSISKGVGEVVDLRKVLSELSLDRTGLVEIGVLMGTDYNPGGIRGIGPKRALSLVRATGSLEEALSEAGIEESSWPNLMKIRDYYLDPPVEESWEVSGGPIDRDGAYNFLVGEKKLGEANTRRLIDLLEPGTNQRELSEWA